MAEAGRLKERKARNQGDTNARRRLRPPGALAAPMAAPFRAAAPGWGRH